MQSTSMHAKEKVRYNMRRILFCLEWCPEGKNDMVVVISKISGNATRQGFVSRSVALWIANRMGDAAVIARKKEEVKFFERMKFLNSFVHVISRNNDRGRFVELKLPNCNACGEVFLKVPEEDPKSCRWNIFAKELSEICEEQTSHG